jgi:hypothetical protein
MEGIVKRFVAKTALTAAIVVGPVVGIGAGNAGATPVYGGALAIAFPGFLPNAHMVNMQIAPAFGPSNLVNNVYAESLRGCLGCNALAVNVQVDLVSFTTTPPNETDVAKVVDKGNGDQNLAAAAMFVVTAPGQVNLSASGRAQLGSIEYQLRALSLVGSTTAAVQGNINNLLGQVLQILLADVTDPSPATSSNQGAPGAPVSPAATSAVSTAPTGGVQITSNVQFAG